MRGIGYDRFHRNVVCQNFIVRIQDHAPLGMSHLLVNVFFGSQPGVLVVLDRLQINQATRKDAEQNDKSSTDQNATNSAIWIHTVREGWLPVGSCLRPLIARESLTARSSTPKPGSS